MAAGTCLLQSVIYFFFSIPVGPAARDHKAQPVFSVFQDIFWNSEPLRRPESNIAESIIDIQLRHLHLRIHANAGMKYHTPQTPWLRSCGLDALCVISR